MNFIEAASFRNVSVRKTNRIKVVRLVNRFLNMVNQINPVPTSFAESLDYQAINAAYLGQKCPCRQKQTV